MVGGRPPDRLWILGGGVSRFFENVEQEVHMSDFEILTIVIAVIGLVLVAVTL